MTPAMTSPDREAVRAAIHRMNNHLAALVTALELARVTSETPVEGVDDLLARADAIAGELRTLRRGVE
jgi:hypothetical protein